MKPDQLRKLLDKLSGEVDHSPEAFANHFRRNYRDTHPHMPIWMAAELMDFGCVFTLYRGVRVEVRRQAAALFGVDETVLESWLRALNTVRNICAHHGRLWNRELGTRPKIPHEKNHPQWHAPVAVSGQRVFGVLTICQWCLGRIAPQSHWHQRLRELFDRFAGIPLDQMGFPDDWRRCPIWTSAGG